MKVYELAAELKKASRELVPYLVQAGVRKTHHLTPLSAAQVDRVRALVAAAAVPPGAGSPFAVPRQTPASPTIPDPPIVAFGSLKGGVGKTTMALCAAELLRTGSPRWPVVVIDADVAGTELHWVWNEQCQEKPAGTPTYQVVSSLIALVEERPDRDETLGHLVTAAKALVAEPGPRRGLVVPTFARHSESKLEALVWKGVLEGSEAFVKRSIERVLRGLRQAGVAVVVDLPAFDVGFAHFARRAVSAAGGTSFLVTDSDVRSVRATLDHLRAHQPGQDAEHWRYVVVNSVIDPRWQTEFRTQVLRALVYTSGIAPDDTPALPKSPTPPAYVPVVVQRADGIRAATEVGGHANDLFKAISAQIDSNKLTADHRRRLRGDATAPADQPEGLPASRHGGDLGPQGRK